MKRSGSQIGAAFEQGQGAYSTKGIDFLAHDFPVAPMRHNAQVVTDRCVKQCFCPLAPGRYQTGALRAFLTTHEFQCDRVDAIALTGRWRAVIEYMTQVRIATRAKQFDALLAVTVVRSLGNFCRIEFPVKARPATARVELAFRTEQHVVTADTMVVPGFGVLIVLSAEGRLGAGLPRHAVLFGV